MFKIKVTAVVNLDGGKIVTVQKAKKDGEKSTKVTLMMMAMPMTMTMTMTLMLMLTLILTLTLTRAMMMMTMTMMIPMLQFQHSLSNSPFLKSKKSEPTEIDGNCPPSPSER